MNVLKGAVALLIVGAVALFAARVVIPPLHCNLVKSYVNAGTNPVSLASTNTQKIDWARQMAAACERCLAAIPNDPDFLTLLGSNQHALGLYDDAEKNYHRSLAMVERPDTYAFLALLELDRGRPAEAREHLYRACLFDMRYVEMVSSPMREEIYEKVIARHTALRSGIDPH